MAYKRSTVLVIWITISVAMALPIIMAAFSPFLTSRNPAYIIGGFAGIVCLALFLLQPLLIAGYLPGLRPLHYRKLHRVVGTAIVLAAILHVAGLYVTSPPDTLDALLLVAPTPFSVYGVIAFAGVLLTALIVMTRNVLGLRYSVWRILHNILALVVVVATVVHAIQIEGAMESISKWALCIAALLVTVATLLDLRVIKPLLTRSDTGSASEADA